MHITITRPRTLPTQQSRSAVFFSPQSFVHCSVSAPLHFSFAKENLLAITIKLLRTIPAALPSFRLRAGRLTFFVAFSPLEEERAVRSAVTCCAENDLAFHISNFDSFSILESTLQMLSSAAKLIEKYFENMTTTNCSKQDHDSWQLPKVTMIFVPL